MPMKNTIKVRQTHKDRLFCNLFSKKENALSLYNALNGTDYKNENELEIVTLEDALYLTMKNDVAICLCGNISLWEQQSSVILICRWEVYCILQENMRDGWLPEKKIFIRRKLLKIPAPTILCILQRERNKARTGRVSSGRCLWASRKRVWLDGACDQHQSG